MIGVLKCTLIPDLATHCLVVSSGWFFIFHALSLSNNSCLSTLLESIATSKSPLESLIPVLPSLLSTWFNPVTFSNHASVGSTSFLLMRVVTGVPCSSLNMFPPSLRIIFSALINFLYTAFEFARICTLNTVNKSTFKL